MTILERRLYQTQTERVICVLNVTQSNVGRVRARPAGRAESETRPSSDYGPNKQYAETAAEVYISDIEFRTRALPRCGWRFRLYRHTYLNTLNIPDFDA
jgi:hypothetical protein